uniref:Uncharacterized protein n=1 Tax=Anguilla anguilla TaxID=7936 RepID=A0A0E9TBS8_ANGAN
MFLTRTGCSTCLRLRNARRITQCFRVA